MCELYANCDHCQAKNPTDNERCWKCRRSNWNELAQNAEQKRFANSGIEAYKQDAKKELKKRIKGE